MAKRSRKSRLNPRTIVLLVAGAAVVFAAGQAVVLMRSDAGALWMARHLGIGGADAIAQIVEREIRRGLEAAGASGDSISETVHEHARPARRLRVGLAPGASLIQTNHAITHRVEQSGGTVLSGRERFDGGVARVTLVVGLPRNPTHEIVLVGPDASTPANAEPARMTIILYGFGEDPEHAAAHFDLPVPFAAAVVPGAQWSGAMFRAANERRREIVLHLPLEPLNYPGVNPGPGTILVTMSPSRVTGVLRKHIDQAKQVSAVANYMGSLATQDMAVMTAVFRELKRRQLPFLHVNGAPGAVCEDLAADLGVAYEEPSAMLDPGKFSSDRELNRAWNAVLEEARSRGRMIVWMRASEKVLDWLPGAAGAKRLEGVNLVPLSAVVRGPVVT